MKHSTKKINLSLAALFTTVIISTHAAAVTTASQGVYSDAVEINWDDMSYAKNYKVYRSKNYDGPYLAKSDKVNGNSWIDSDAESGIYYWYKIKPYYFYGIPGLSDDPATGWIQIGHLAETADASAEKTLLKIAEKLPHWNVVSTSAGLYQEQASDVGDTASLIPSTEQLYEWIAAASINEHRRIGTDFGHQAEDYIIAELQKIMDEHCPTCEVKSDRFTINARDVESYGLRIKQNDTWQEFPSFFANNTGFTVDNHGGTVTGEMIYAGEGTVEDFDNLRNTYGDDLSDKILVIDTPTTILPWGFLSTALELDGAYYISDPDGDVNIDTKLPASAFMTNFGHDYEGAPRNPSSIYWRAYDMNAAGVIAILKDYPGNTNKHWGPYGDKALEAMPALFVDKITGEQVIDIALSGEQAEITLQGTVDPNGWARNIYVQLPGKSEETIFVTTHHDAAFKGATEDGTGISMVLAMAKTWAQVPFEQREKSILFHLSAGHFYGGIGARTFAETHKNDLLKDAIININLEHLAARGTIEDETTHELVLDGDKPALTLLWVSEDLATITAAKNMLAKYQPRFTSAIPGNLFGEIPPGESGHYHKTLGIPYINYLGAPRYLLSADDTMDKVDIPRLRPSAIQSAELIESYMVIPENYDLWTAPYKERSLLP
jgi:hypothetical protein